jgi:Fe2+ transport system protein FeoA
MKIYRPILIIAAALLLFAPISLAQTGKLYRVGFLSPGGFAPSTNPGRLTDEIVRHLTQSGFTPGVNLEVVKRGGGGALRAPAGPDGGTDCGEGRCHRHL